MDLYRILICELTYLSGVTTRFALHDFEFRIVILLNWLPPKARNPRLSYYLTQTRGRKIFYFSKSIVCENEWNRLARIWTRLSHSIFCGDHRHTTHKSHNYYYYYYLSTSTTTKYRHYFYYTQYYLSLFH